MQWLQDPHQSNVHNLNNVRCEASRCFRNKKKEHLTVKIDELVTNSKIKNITELFRGIMTLRWVTNLQVIKVEGGELFTDSHSILAGWRNYFSQPLNVHGVNDVRHTEIHTAKPLVPKQSTLEDEMATEKLKRNKSPGIDQTQGELIKARVEQFALRSINLLILFGITWNCLRSGRSRSLYLSIRRTELTNLTEVFPCFFLSCKANSRV